MNSIMKVRKFTKILIVVAALLLAAVIIIVCCKFTSCSQKLDFSACFYYVCHEKPYTESSASSMSSAVASYGGAGYIINCNDDYYVTVSCYYAERDAESVKNTLKKKGLSCTVVKAEVDGIDLKGRAKKNSQRYVNNLNTLLSMSHICYDLANSMETSKTDQGGAKQVLSQVEVTLKGLLRENSANCFKEELSRLVAECEDVSEGYVFPRDVRRLQIAVTDTIVNIKLY